MEGRARLATLRPWLAAALPLLLTAGVYYPITRNFFYGDDFLWLLAAENDGVLRTVLRPWAGHELLVRNLVFYASYQLFGLHAELFFWTVLLVHLVNVWLVFRVIATLTSSLALACFGATLWGTSPLAAGTLDWYSAFGHALAATCLLVVLDGLSRQADTGLPLRGRTAWSWYALVLAGAACFGIGLGAALAFPAVLFLWSPATWRQRGVRAGYLMLPIVTVAVYLGLRRLSWLLEPPPPFELASEHLSWLRLVKTFPPLVHLLGFGGAGVAQSFFFSPDRYPDVGTGITLTLLAAGLALVLWRGRGTAKRVALAMTVLCVGAYAAVGWGRGLMFANMSAGMRLIFAATRYHYLPTIAIVVVICLAVQELGRLPGLRAVPRTPLLLAALALGAYGYGVSKSPITDYAWTRDAFEAARRSIDAEIRLRSSAEAVAYLDNGQRQPEFLGVVSIRREFPGRAALYVLGSAGDSPAGPRVRFVERDPAILAWWARRPRTPLADLLVGPAAVSAPAR